MPSRLSVCTLTRDDEAQIERALGSWSGSADELIVADTGSADHTVDVARKLGAKVINVVWDNDFAAGRNAAIHEASGDWILWINPDEERISPEPETIRALLDGASERLDFFGVTIQEVPKAGRFDEFSAVSDLRLFRKSSKVHFVGRLHPAIDFGMLPIEPGRFSPSEIVLRRHAYTSTMDESKVRWAIRLLELELTERPGRLHYVIEYGRNLLLLNDMRGHEVMAQAVDALQPFISHPIAPHPEAQILLEYVINTPKALYRGTVAPGLAVALALKWFPDSPPLLWGLAELCFKTNQIRPAAGYLERLVHLKQTGRYDRTRSFDPRIFGSWALMNLGQCRRALGDEPGARVCFEALKADPEFGAEAERLLSISTSK